VEKNDEFRERTWREQRLAARLRLATERLEEAQRERMWTEVESHQSGLSIRQIAATTGLSSSRVHQVLSSQESRETPRWLSQRRDQQAARSQGHSGHQAHLAGEMDEIPRCREWLERLERGEQVVVNLRPETDPETEYVSFNRPRLVRVVARNIADPDELAGFPPIAEEEAKMEGAKSRRVRHRRLLAKRDPTPKRLTMRKERAALPALLDLPPSEKWLNEPGQAPLIGMFRPTPPDCVVCTGRRTGFEVTPIRPTIGVQDQLSERRLQSFASRLGLAARPAGRRACCFIKSG